MAQITFTLFLILASAAAVIKAAAVFDKGSPRGKPGFLFLGPTKREIRGACKKNYWISANSAGYAEARRDCEANGDALLQIDSTEKLTEIAAFLEDSDQTVSFFWVGGNFDSDKNTFAWENGGCILSGLWAAGEPRQWKPNSRVAANTAGKTLKLVSKPNTQSYRYICEG